MINAQLLLQIPNRQLTDTDRKKQSKKSSLFFPAFSICLCWNQCFENPWKPYRIRIKPDKRPWMAGWISIRTIQGLFLGQNISDPSQFHPKFSNTENYPYLLFLSQLDVSSAKCFCWWTKCIVQSVFWILSFLYWNQCSTAAPLFVPIVYNDFPNQTGLKSYKLLNFLSSAQSKYQ